MILIIRTIENIYNLENNSFDDKKEIKMNSNLYKFLVTLPFDLDDSLQEIYNYYSNFCNF